MRYWDSRTSATAASTSALIVLYCALRSSSGTFIICFLLQLAITLLAHFELRWKRSLFVKIQAAQHAWYDFLVLVSSLRTDHNAVRVGGQQTMAMAAHPADSVARISDDQSIIR